MIITGRAFFYLLMLGTNIFTIIIQFNSKEPMVWLIVLAGVLAGYFFHSLLGQLDHDNEDNDG